MGYKSLLILIFISISIPLFSNVDKGEIDLRYYSFKGNDPISLAGDWKVSYKNGLTEFSQVPGSWRGNLGTVKYSLVVKSSGVGNLLFSLSQINTQFTFYLNSELIASDRQNRSMYIPLTLKKGDNLLEFYITNNTEKFGGFRSTPYLGDFNKVLKRYEKNILRDTLISGASIIMFLFFLVLFLNFRNDKSTLFFALICLFLAIRGVVTNDKIIFNFIPNLSYFWLNKLEYISIYIIPLLTLLFIFHYYKKSVLPRISLVMIGISTFFPLILIFTPPKIYISFLYLFYSFIGLSSLFIIINLSFCIKQKKEDSLRILVSIITLFIAAVFDSFNLFFNYFDFQILPSSMIVFILSMSYIVSQREIRKIKKIENLTLENIKVIRYLSKFVPNAFVKTVGMGNISSIKRGDGVDKDMTIIFTSIIGFKKELKLYKAEETIGLLNRCYSLIAPIISDNGGFIDKFIDETVMALFPGRPEDAIKAVIEINKRLEKFNSSNSFGKPLKMRTGIHIGSQTIGLVGDEKRVDATVISKVVNTASRINSFTEKISRDILISEDVYNKLENPSLYSTLFMGRVKLKGKQNFIGIYSLYTKSIQESDRLFSITMKKLEDSPLEKIEHVLMNILKIEHNHKPSKYFLNLIKKNKCLEDLDK
ncbi:adenylate/guanylate cyclase domain-containing protein [Thiospirochaeta perfilievii]|uniref:Adenylate/guanylate cyclase domain-containing protein n=1 Tax=Thiospirochaeta perfilievii TaxID=252967 RepID=A0A5C1Q7J7_9SPIO|nr:adenylate/guanylate cyclase domain-containing protein [Thiospirochaeta perfilievii]QEN03288.1 adenylate/guanylate cyclase domain-containing protein [Thiospirochaeta perfilievii]